MNDKDEFDDVNHEEYETGKFAAWVYIEGSD
jgi:hypothetical protein